MPAPSPAPRPGSLPVELTTFVGRERELGALGQLIGTCRLLTLTGAGGSGKTRLAAELAPRLAAVAPDGVTWVELGPLGDGQLVAGEILRALDPTQEGDRGLAGLVATLQDRAALLVLDNCEHLVEACAELADGLLRNCPRLHILATSREALGVPGERAWLVPPLAVPTADTPLAELERFDAVRLFLDRARDVAPDFALTPQNAAAVAAICYRLDGLPLAIQLAAARVRLMTPEQIRDRLSDAFALLTSRARTGVPRHRTLRAAIDWSYQLLDAESAALLRRLSVFRGGFTLDAVEATAAGEPAGDVLDRVAGLVDRSLVLMREQGDAARYYLLEIVRQYAAGKLAEAAEERAVRAAFAAWVSVMVSEAEPAFTTPERVTACARLEAELDNIRDVLAWSRSEDPAAFVRLVGMLWWFWFSTRHWTEARRWIDDALALPAARQPDRVRAALLFASGALYALQANVPASRAALEEAIALAADQGEPRLEAYARNYLGMTYAGIGAREAIEHSGRAAEWFRAHGDLYGLRLALLLVGVAEAANGNVERAEALMREAVTIARAFGRDRELAIAQQTLAVILLDLGRGQEAEVLLAEALQSLGRDSSYLFLGRALEFLGVTIAARDPRAAARYLGAGDALRRHVGAQRFMLDQRRLDAVIPRLRETLGEAGYERAYRDGAVAPPADLIAEALAGSLGPPQAAAEPAPAPAAAPVEPAPAGGERLAAVDAAGAGADLRVRVLGGFEVWVEGQPVTAWPYAKPRELLAFLLTHRRGRNRTDIAAAIWPDASPAQLRNNFHVTLHHLRKAMGHADWIVLDEERYRLAPGLGIDFDAAVFEAQLRPLLAAAAPGVNRTAALRAALAHYRGPFLDGEAAGHWREEEQDRLRRLYCEGALALGQLLEAAGEVSEAIAVYDAAVVQEPLLEAAHRRLLALWAQAGDRVRALRYYDRLNAVLQDELGLEPEPETVALYERIRRGELAAGDVAVQPGP